MVSFATQVETAPVTAPAPEMVKTVAPNTLAGAPTVVAPAAPVLETGATELKLSINMPFVALAAADLTGLANALDTTPAAVLDAMVRAGLLPKAEAARVPL